MGHEPRNPAPVVCFAARYGKLGRSETDVWAAEGSSSSLGAWNDAAEPGVLRSVARLRLCRAACGLHHSLLVSEVVGKRTGGG